MAMVQNQLHNSLVESFETMALTTTMTTMTTTTPSSTIHSAGNGSNGDNNISNANQKGDGPKIMNTTENDLIKIIPYEVNITKVFMAAF